FSRDWSSDVCSSDLAQVGVDSSLRAGKLGHLAAAHARPELPAAGNEEDLARRLRGESVVGHAELAEPGAFTAELLIARERALAGARRRRAGEHAALPAGQVVP